MRAIAESAVSLVPQALTGQVPQLTSDDMILGRRGRRKRGKEASLDQAFKNIFMGIAFLLVAIVLSKSIGNGWWFWMLIPAFSMMGTGVAQFIRLKESQKQPAVRSPPVSPAIQDRPVGSGLSAPKTGELLAPVPSVTEGTTRHLGAEAPTRHLDGSSDDQK